MSTPEKAPGFSRGEHVTRILLAVIVAMMPMAAHSQTEQISLLRDAKKFAVYPAPSRYGDQNTIQVDDKGNGIPNPNFMFNFPQYSLYANQFQTPEKEDQARQLAAEGWSIMPLYTREFCLSLQNAPIKPWDPNESSPYDFLYNNPPMTYARLNACVGSIILDMASGIS
jgi:hypothetical protein